MGRGRRSVGTRVVGLIGIAVIAGLVSLAGCVASEPTAPASSWSPRSVTPPPSVAAPKTPKGPTSPKPVKLPDPCSLSPEQVSTIVGKTYADANATSVSGSKVCTYVGSMESPSVTMQTAPLATSLSDLTKESAKVFTDTSTVGAEVAGADQALLTTGTVSTAPAVLVSFAHERVYAMVLIIAPSGDYTDEALELAVALAKATG